MSKILVVFGATGQQGSSVVSYVKERMSDRFKIRAITRDPYKPEAKALEESGVEVVKADLGDKQSIKQAFKGADTIFAMTAVSFGGQTELEQGKIIADAAVEEKVPNIIWSTLPSANEISNGEFTHVVHFDEKAEVEKYIRSLPINSSFFSPGCFMQNFATSLKPQPVGDGKYTMFNVMRPASEFPFFDTDDTGKFVGAILNEPEKFHGKILYAATDLYSYEVIARIISKDTGKNVNYQQIPANAFREQIPKPIAEEITEMFQYVDKYNHYGSETREKVEWGKQQVSEKLTTLEEYFKRNPLGLE
ncbi:DEHA2A10274p [Debaryomyces hansenii CBS767]|uniref:DEHA2A10274p n=1 Tax=Debaryomyces hansenii (strain ATCC 36239 / CBS 767 / BCRC 21394 / JCM 1990 / NBRC 0083 / IGC 2968) TaxID=284592 RepID=Q6BYE1_DEBHA|nr:DEHA2A10274p [Debaryomyces hansenii CBS767]CAG84741.2 DEHA2A10274p [Debaryomyces hansenii CBS767]|eukprot:XP_456778.2 DEHA2A10274p [Debaryomyces hansenii CBS767]